MTTVVEPEFPRRRPKGIRLLLAAAALVAAVVLIIVGACTLGGDEPSGAMEPPETLGDASYVADGSVVLQNYGTLTSEAAQFWRDLTLDHVLSLGVPFSRYNRYYTRFFLKEGETIEILIEANVPLGASLEQALEGVSVAMIPSNAPYDEANRHTYLPQTENADGGYFQRLERVGGNWTVNWAMTALGSDYYWLVLTNTARQDAWCHFTVSVPSG